MYFQEEKKRFLAVAANLIILVFQARSFGYVWSNCYDSPYFFRGDYVVIALYMAFVYLITKSFNGYKINYMRVSYLCVSHVVAIVLGGAVAYAFICMALNEYESIAPILALVGVQILFTIIWIVIVRTVQSYIYPPRQMVVIYGNYPPDDFLNKLDRKSDRYEIREILNYDEGYKKICQDIAAYEGVILYDLPSDERNSILKFCYKNSIRTYVVPKITDIVMRESEELYLVDTPLFLARNQGLHLDQRIVKRIMDIVVSLLGIVVLSPVMLITALVIKLYDKGPVLYKQIRFTRDKKTFTIYKFRSMSVNAEQKGARLASKGDSRITPIGRVIRRAHIDEIPQLFNVLKGDMSIVGPRPERPEIFEKYSKSIPEFDFRLKVKAGITGYAQVHGKYNTTPIDKLKLDLVYIERYSFLLDLKLMLLTLRIIFSKDSTEGIEAGQFTALSEGKNDRN
ncbi:MAG: exopolysaccharide biosynthesis polyprenyl glycosylphosphotransferase [Lachnospiraceae bacterium]|nr:exopolysaccharide biosynthesis polyprenyl glycosylphosphotransferase [Lachnospiraceae bacterium]